MEALRNQEQREPLFLSAEAPSQALEQLRGQLAQATEAGTPKSGAASWNLGTPA